MANYVDMVNRIANESLRSDLTNEIKLCIQEAIDFYKKERFWFNQFNNKTFNTVAGQEFYNSTALADIADIIMFDSVTILDGSTRYTLEPYPWEVMESISSTNDNRGKPTRYCYWGQKIRLYPIPDAIYPITIAGVFSLSALSADTDQNAWTNEAEPLIRYRASALLHGNYLRDYEAESRFSSREDEQLSALVISTQIRQATGNISPSL